MAFTPKNGPLECREDIHNFYNKLQETTVKSSLVMAELVIGLGYTIITHEFENSPLVSTCVCSCDTLR